MLNPISLTVRLPEKLDEELTTACKSLGMPKTTLIRICIHDFLQDSNTTLDFSPCESAKTKRLVLNVNEHLNALLDDTALRAGCSVNAVVIAVSALALERATKWLQ